MSRKKFVIYGSTTIRWMKKIEEEDMQDAEDFAEELRSWSWPSIEDTVTTLEPHAQTQIDDIELIK